MLCVSTGILLCCQIPQARITPVSPWTAANQAQPSPKLLFCLCVAADVVDEVVEMTTSMSTRRGCWGVDDDGEHEGMCQCLSVKPRGTKGPGWSLCFVRTQSIVNSNDAAADAR